MTAILRNAPAIRQAKQARTFRIIKAPTQTEPGWVRVTIDGEQTDYQFSFIRVADAMGLCAVGFLRTDSAVCPCHVRVDEAGHGECDCLEHLRFGRCKHADLASMLVWQIGRIAAQQNGTDTAAEIVKNYRRQRMTPRSDEQSRQLRNRIAAIEESDMLPEEMPLGSWA
jgi:hypothetical protein